APDVPPAAGEQESCPAPAHLPEGSRRVLPWRLDHKAGRREGISREAAACRSARASHSLSAVKSDEGTPQRIDDSTRVPAVSLPALSVHRTGCPAAVAESPVHNDADALDLMHGTREVVVQAPIAVLDHDQH